MDQAAGQLAEFGKPVATGIVIRKGKAEAAHIRIGLPTELWLRL